MSLVLSCFIIGCSDNESTDNGDGNATPTASGEILGILIYTTNYVPDPVSGAPSAQSILSDVTPAIEDNNGNIYILSAEGRETHFEYDGLSVSEANITIVDYTYTVDPSNYEWRDVGGQNRKISHTGIQVAVEGTISTVTEGSLPGDWIDIEAIEEIS